MFTLLLSLFLLSNLSDLQGRAIRIADGDTITIPVDRQQVRVRLDSIDAPEKQQDYSQRSRQALSDLVFGKEVRVEMHGKDRYGRVIGDVYAGPTFVNEVLVREGWAWNYVKYSKSHRLAELERQARAERRRLWAGKNPIPPWEYRAEQARKRQEKRQSRSRVPTNNGSHR
jgi:endonuclease YncB( thermonuclease family)